MHALQSLVVAALAVAGVSATKREHSAWGKLHVRSHGEVNGCIGPNFSWNVRDDCPPYKYVWGYHIEGSGAHFHIEDLVGNKCGEAGEFRACSANATNWEWEIGEQRPSGPEDGEAVDWEAATGEPKPCADAPLLSHPDAPRYHNTTVTQVVFIWEGVDPPSQAERMAGLGADRPATEPAPECSTTRTVPVSSTILTISDSFPTVSTVSTASRGGAGKVTPAARAFVA